MAANTDVLETNATSGEDDSDEDSEIKQKEQGIRKKKEKIKKDIVKARKDVNDSNKQLEKKKPKKRQHKETGDKLEFFYFFTVTFR